ncbi:MAG: InlB B-repeat-containing protein [Clostridia bacterium]|nr:InlB B-repeat-containing protein [Clostridia bacterium]
MRVSKKVSAILLLVLSFAIILGNFSMVQAVDAAKITVSTASAKAGESVTITVSGLYQYEIAHATFTITYDSSVLSLSSYTTPNLGQSGAYSAVNTGTAGKIIYAYAYPDSTATSGNFLTLTFAVSQSAPVGDSVVTISSNEIGNNVYPHTGTVVAGGVTVSASNITVTYKAETGGTVSSSSETVDASTGTLKGSTATASSGYTFNGWYNASGTKVSSNATYVPTSKTTATYTAKFTENQVTITYSTEGQGGVVSSTSETVNVVTGTVKGSTATANTGYIFDGWYDADGNKISDNSTFIPTSKTTTTYYAKFSFAILYGDIDGDKIVDASDALLVLQFTVDKISNFSDVQKESADVDDDGEISISDALYILHKSVDKIDKFPVEL